MTGHRSSSAVGPAGAVRLRLPTPRDVRRIVAWESAAEARPFIQPWPAERHLSALRDPFFGYHIIEIDSRAAGFVLLAGLPGEGPIELRRIVIGRKGRGTGHAACQLLFAELGHEARRRGMWLDVRADNARARCLYETLGFTEQRVERAGIQSPDGRWHDLVVYQRFGPLLEAGRDGSRRAAVRPSSGIQERAPETPRTPDEGGR
jgi:diamine N-acetyltransferase